MAGLCWYGMVSVDFYSAIVTKVSNALNAAAAERILMLHSNPF